MRYRVEEIWMVQSVAETQEEEEENWVEELQACKNC